jgi:hypothetical protein
MSDLTIRPACAELNEALGTAGLPQIDLWD